MKAFIKSLRVLAVLAALTLWLPFSGCEDSPTEPAPPSTDLQLSAQAKGAAQSGWQLQNTLNTQDQLSGMVSGGAHIFDEEGMLNSISDIRKEENTLKKIYSYAEKSGGFAKISGDSLIWYEEWSLGQLSGRRALYYNNETQTARSYEVIFQFPQFLRLEYDSTQFILFVGPSLQDPADDRLLSIDKLTRFEANYFVERVESHAEATDWNAQNQVSGAIAGNTVWYGAQTELLKLQQNAELNPDESGSISERLDYRDSTFLSREVNFYANHTGDFNETWRDGTTVSGAFDLLEDDNHAAVTRIIDFAQNFIVDKIEQGAEYTLDPQDSSSAAVLREKITFRNGAEDTARVEVERFFDAGQWNEHFVVQTSHRGQSDFTVIYYDDYKTFAGEHTTPEGYYILFNGAEYAAGNGEILLEVYASKQAYLNGEPPILTLHIIYNGDGSGRGELAEGGKTYQVVYKPNGEITVRDSSGKTASLTGY
ncbi:MAG: hypothetical protein HUU32_02725 [Calditrichaceae bacterium]|nr:hypothetical protein [Calditrichia bacterium]NUQ40292.1 hypothetical protein [Calditrichaceae bacterium]